MFPWNRFQHVPTCSNSCVSCAFPGLLPAYLLKRSVRKASGATSENVSVVKILMFSRATPAPAATISHNQPQSLKSDKNSKTSSCFLSHISRYINIYQHCLKDTPKLRSVTFNCICFLTDFFSKKLKETERGNCSHGMSLQYTNRSCSSRAHLPFLR